MGRSFSLFRPRTKARSHAATKKCPTRAHSSGHSVIRIHCTDAAFHCGEGTLTYHLAGLSSLQVASQEVVNQGRITRHSYEALAARSSVRVADDPLRIQRSTSVPSWRWNAARGFPVAPRRQPET